MSLRSSGLRWLPHRTRPDRSEEPVRRLYQVDLWEISIVTFPLLNGARVEALDEFIRELRRGER
jgi:phage head maturation protease